VQFTRVIDLSHALRPGTEARRLDITRVDASAVTGHEDDGGWYIMHSIAMDNHIGTHVEVPYHCLPEGADLGRIPAQQFAGEAAILDLRGYDPGAAIPLTAVQQAAAAAGGIRRGDIVLCMTGWSDHYGTEDYSTPPYLSREALVWLVDHGLKILGVDTPGAMDPGVPDRQNHLPIFEAGTLYIENLCNLDSVPQSRCFAVALPPAIEGLDALPIRVVAFV
jgi:arylformamidase